MALYFYRMKGHILIADTDADSATPLTVEVEREGYSVHRVDSGAETLVRLQTTAVDMVLLEMQLPDMSGKDVLRHIRFDRGTSDIPVIMVTSCAEEIDRIVALELGADDYVSKPFSIRELVLRIRLVLRRRRSMSSTQ